MTSRKKSLNSIYLDNLGHGKTCLFFFFTWGSYHVLIAQHLNYKPEKNEDHLSAPETLLQGASCSFQTNLGCLVSRARTLPMYVVSSSIENLWDCVTSAAIL